MQAHICHPNSNHSYFPVFVHVWLFSALHSLVVISQMYINQTSICQATLNMDHSSLVFLDLQLGSTAKIT